MEARKVCIVASKRIPFTRSFKEYADSNNQEMTTHVLKALVEELNLKDKHVGEVALGGVIKHSSDWNLARESVLGSGLAATTPGTVVQKACGTSLETAIIIANKIALGQIECGIAGGTDTNSDAPVGLNRKASQKFVRLSQARTFTERFSVLKKFSPKDIIPVAPQVVEPRTGKSMGQHCELMAQEWNISRSEQDKLSFESHVKAADAYERGFYNDLVVEFKGVTKDTILRPGTTIEKLSKLKPAFERSEKGTITAGNATAFTDGAAAVFMCSEDYAKKNNLKVLAYFKDGQSWSLDYVNGAGLLMAPTVAVGKLIERNNLKLQDFDFYEIHEAFAAQVLCTLKAWEDEGYCREHIGSNAALGSIDRSKMNIKGGSLALGHPFGATGARIVGSLAKMISEKGSGTGLISICTAGGMGVAAIIEKA